MINTCAYKTACSKPRTEVKRGLAMLFYLMSHVQILVYVHNLIKYMATPLEHTKHGHKLPEPILGDRTAGQDKLQATDQPQEPQVWLDR